LGENFYRKGTDVPFRFFVDRLLTLLLRLYFLNYLKFDTMGRGDKKTKKGKIFKGSFGKVRAARRLTKKVAVAAKEA
jgi:30S ribosomal protein S31